MSRPLISLIIPVYKTELYINKCVDSLINQTYQNIEIILIDDGSPDNCGKICDEYKEKDNRVTVIHKENGGLSDARNAGIDAAKGDYISFIDSDDYVSQKYVEYLYTLISNCSADIASCCYKRIKNEHTIIKNRNYQNRNILYNKIDSYNLMFEMLLYNESRYISACGKLYCKHLFSAIRFPKNTHYEDAVAVPELLNESESAVFGCEVHYYYRRHSESITNASFSDKCYERIETTKNWCELVSGNYKNMEKALNRQMFLAYVHVLRKYITDKPDFDKTEALRLRKHSIFYGKGLVFNPKASVRDKAAYISLVLGLKPFAICWALYERAANRY